jgi:hypothetical protein
VSASAVVVVYDVSCPKCSRIARELPDLVRVPVIVRSCREKQLDRAYPGIPAQVLSCAAPAIGIVRRGRIRWWTGLSGALGLLPLLRLRELREAAELLGTALVDRR